MDFKNDFWRRARGQGRPKCRLRVSFSFLNQIKALSLFTAKSCDPPIKRYKAKCDFNFVNFSSLCKQSLCCLAWWRKFWKGPCISKSERPSSLLLETNNRSKRKLLKVKITFGLISFDRRVTALNCKKWKGLYLLQKREWNLQKTFRASLATRGRTFGVFISTTKYYYYGLKSLVVSLVD